MLPFFILLYHNILMNDQQLVAVIMSGLLILLIWGRWRYDGVVLVTLAIMVLLGLIEPREAFSGFSHPAVITVALVLLISKGLEKSGFINQIGEFLSSVVHWHPSCSGRSVRLIWNRQAKSLGIYSFIQSWI